ncbi:H-NS histone family protein [Thiohalocapsa marina]|nr:H-NS histone family protein [Thiohalocapsa marina]
MSRFEHLDLEALQQQMQATAEEHAEIERLLQQKLKEAKGDFVRSLRAQITEQGYDVVDIANQLLGRKRGSVAPISGSYYVDPDDPSNTYKRGPLPRWLKEKMLAAGLDPESKQQRDDYKADHLTFVSA